MSTLPLQLLATAYPSLETTPQTSPISFQTALLVLLVGALLILAKKLTDLNQRLAQVELRTRPPFPAEAKTEPSRTDRVIAPETIAAICAAIHTTLGSRARLVAVGEICPKRQDWSAEGRRLIFQSHKVR